VLVTVDEADTMHGLLHQLQRVAAPSRCVLGRLPLPFASVEHLLFYHLSNDDISKILPPDTGSLNSTISRQRSVSLYD
jgi:hypothetical protein